VKQALNRWRFALHKSLAAIRANNGTGLGNIQINLGMSFIYATIAGYTFLSGIDCLHEAKSLR
jgi:hypothetical protein